MPSSRTTPWAAFSNQTAHVLASQAIQPDTPTNIVSAAAHQPTTHGRYRADVPARRYASGVISHNQLIGHLLHGLDR